MVYTHSVGGSSPSSCTRSPAAYSYRNNLCGNMVDVVELVDTPDCGSGAAALRVQVSSSTP